MNTLDMEHAHAVAARWGSPSTAEPPTSAPCSWVAVDMNMDVNMEPDYSFDKELELIEEQQKERQQRQQKERAQSNNTHDDGIKEVLYEDPKKCCGRGGQHRYGDSWYIPAYKISRDGVTSWIVGKRVPGCAECA